MILLEEENFILNGQMNLTELFYIKIENEGEKLLEKLKKK